jgi:hypothetical protein
MFGLASLDGEPLHKLAFKPVQQLANANHVEVVHIKGDYDLPVLVVEDVDTQVSPWPVKAKD